MESITLGQIAGALALIAGVVTSVALICRYIKQALTKWLDDSMKPLMDRMDKIREDIRQDIDEVKLENCKNYIENFLSKVEVGDKITSDSLKRYYENYELYGRLGGNSYIHDWHEKLKAAGKLHNGENK